MGEVFLLTFPFIEQANVVPDLSRMEYVPREFASILQPHWHGT